MYVSITRKAQISITIAREWCCWPVITFLKSLLGKSRKMASPLIASAHLLPDAKLWWLFLNCTIKGLDFTLLPLTDHRARTGAPRCWWQRHDCSLVLCLCKCLVRSRTKAGLVVMTGLWCLFRFEFTCTVCCFFFLEWKWLFIWAKKRLILYISVTFYWG